MESPWRSTEAPRPARWVCVALLAASCTVEAGSTSAVPCAPSPSYFVSDVWPRYLVPELCGTASCHSFEDGQGVMRFHGVAADAAPAANAALTDWPLSWRENYLSAIQYLRCDAPAQSRILSMPEGIGNLHPPGPVVRDRATARSVIEQWVASP
jgi:hypothetical protein